MNFHLLKKWVCQVVSVCLPVDRNEKINRSSWKTCGADVVENIFLQYLLRVGGGNVIDEVLIKLLLYGLVAGPESSVCPDLKILWGCLTSGEAVLSTLTSLLLLAADQQQLAGGQLRPGSRPRLVSLARVEK